MRHARDDPSPRATCVLRVHMHACPLGRQRVPVPEAQGHREEETEYRVRGHVYHHPTQSQIVPTEWHSFCGDMSCLVLSVPPCCVLSGPATWGGWSEKLVLLQGGRDRNGATDKAQNDESNEDWKLS